MRCAVCMYSICSSDKIFSGVLRIIVTMHIYANMHICFRLFWGIITFAQFVPEERKPEGFQPHQMLSDQLLLSGEAMAALNLTNRNVLDKSFIDFFLPAASCFPSISRKMKVVAKCETSKRQVSDLWWSVVAFRSWWLGYCWGWGLKRDKWVTPAVASVYISIHLVFIQVLTDTRAD